jgi:glycosyltransferase involved in cell wall biosynthesis
MKFSIITPVKNGIAWFEKCIESILVQVGNFEIEYLIMDGGSTDGSYELALEYQRQLHLDELKISCNSLSLIVYQESDNGMYDALSTGFSKATGNIVCYLNADDLFFPNAFKNVCRVFSTNPEVFWISGIPQSLNPDGSVYYNNMPGPYRLSLIMQGFYGPLLPFIQQESTFWRRELLNEVNLEQLKSCKLAGDFLLWKTFAKNYKLWILGQALAGARIHPNRMSGDLKAYFNEQKQLADPKTLKGKLVAHFDFMFWRFLPQRLKMKLMKEQLIH